MAVTLGKRKRRADINDSQPESSASDENARTLFQRAFEAKFMPLPKIFQLVKPLEDIEDDSLGDDGEDSDWSGLSQSGNDVEVVDHDSARDEDDAARRKEMKAFMSSKPPIAQQVRTVRTPKQPEADTEEKAKESANLKHDLALQRLLKESHLLDSSSFNGTTATPEGKTRLKALDLRLQDLGATKASSEQEKMPLAHRKGIKAKAANRETARRKEATENGVILEKVKMTRAPEKRRERGISTPSVGKFKGGTLKLSSREVRSIEGPKQRSGSKGRRR